jgi:MFS family permease
MHPFQNRQFRLLFTGQAFSLVGTGLLTVALSLTAYRLGGAAEAGRILSLILALKMIAYIGIAPLGEVLLSGMRPKQALIALNALRMLLLPPMALIDSANGLMAITFIFFAVSATFTPLFQATIPVILTDEQTYAKALSLSRLAYTLESVLSPVLAGLALAVVTEASLFPLAAVAFAASIIALACAGLDLDAAPARKAPFLERLSRGVRIEILTPRLRGLVAMNLALSLGLAWVLVNTVVFVGVRFEGDAQIYTMLMTGYGLGAAAAALAVPRFLERFTERRLMIAGCVLFAIAGPVILVDLPVWGFILCWAVLGAASSIVLTPGGLVLNRSARPGDRPALFAAQFSLSHAAWLIAYPLAGWLGSSFGVESAMIILAVAVLAMTVIAARLWPVNDPIVRPHRHDDLPADHPHLEEIRPSAGERAHAHPFYIDEHHPRWSM